MTTYRVDAETVLQVGAALVDVAEGLATMADPHADRWAFGAGGASLGTEAGVSRSLAGGGR